ncbi:MAG: hypothetical protein OXC80_10830 [Gammaproteobacteria bacterium]|nr:hypothetical protein [Gammaproteobacteria bacterium]
MSRLTRYLAGFRVADGATSRTSPSQSATLSVSQSALSETPATDINHDGNCIR